MLLFSPLMWTAESVCFLFCFITALTSCVQSINRAANLIVRSCVEQKWLLQREQRH